MKARVIRRGPAEDAALEDGHRKAFGKGRFSEGTSPRDTRARGGGLWETVLDLEHPGCGHFSFSKHCLGPVKPEVSVQGTRRQWNFLSDRLEA